MTNNPMSFTELMRALSLLGDKLAVFEYWEISRQSSERLVKEHKADASNGGICFTQPSVEELLGRPVSVIDSPSEMNGAMAFICDKDGRRLVEITDMGARRLVEKL